MTADENYDALIWQYKQMIQEAKDLLPRLDVLVPADKDDKLDIDIKRSSLEVIILRETKIDYLEKVERSDIYKEMCETLSRGIETSKSLLENTKEYIQQREAQLMLPL